MNGKNFVDASSVLDFVGNDIVTRVNRIIENMNKIGVENLASIKLNKSCDYTAKAGKSIISIAEIAKDIGEKYDNTNERTGMVL